MLPFVCVVRFMTFLVSMKKKNSAFVKALLTVVVIGLLSWLVLKVVNKEINPDLAIGVDVAEIGQKVLQAIVDFVLSLINPERRGFF